MLTMSEAVDDMFAFTQLDDTVYNRILYSKDPRLESARAILNNVQRRRLYKLIGQSYCSENRETGNKTVEEQKVSYDLLLFRHRSWGFRVPILLCSFLCLI